MKIYILLMIITLLCSNFSYAFTCNVGGAGFPTVQSAINKPSCNPIKLSSRVFSENVTIFRSVTLKGSSGSVLKGKTAGSVVTVAAGINVDMVKLSITGGSAIDGGGIFNAGTLTLSRINIYGNRASHEGGGIYSVGPLLADNIAVKNNTANQAGVYNAGGIYVSGTDLTIASSKVEGNSGRGIYIDGSNATIKNSTVSLNDNGIYLADAWNDKKPSTLTIRNSQVSLNQGHRGIFVGAENQVVIEDSRISENSYVSCNYGGGGIYNHYGVVNIFGSEVVRNIASDTGGGISNVGEMVIKESLIADNVADPSANRVICNTWATWGGGIINSEGTLQIYKSAIVNNRSDEFGGGVVQASKNGFLKIRNSTISNNKARKHGGGIAVLSYNPADVATNKISFNHVTIVENSANRKAGGIYVRKFKNKLPYFSVLSTVIAKNLPSNCNGQFTISEGHNLDDSASCQWNTPTDISLVNPMIGSLINGQYHLPLNCSSPLVNHGVGGGGHDQRGMPRKSPCSNGQARVSDIGAIELQKEP